MKKTRKRVKFGDVKVIPDSPEPCVLAHRDRTTAVLTRAYVHGRLLTTVVDTGASNSCISTRFFQSLPHIVQRRLKAAPGFRAVDAQSKTLKCPGRIYLTLGFPNDAALMGQWWHVIDNLPYDALIGVDYMGAYRASVCLDTACLRYYSPKEERKVAVPVWWLKGSPDETSVVQQLVTTEGVHLGVDRSNVVACTIKVPFGSPPPSTLDGCMGTVIAAVSAQPRPYQAANSVTHLRNVHMQSGAASAHDALADLPHVPEGVAT